MVEDYLLDLVRTSRRNAAIELGVSPRGALALNRAGQALAAIRGRAFVIPDDIKHLTVPVLAHRLILSPDARLHGQTALAVIAKLVDQVPVPVEETWSASSQR